MDAETLDLIVRSRSTILEILENRGYNVDAYKAANPAELVGYATSSSDTKLLHIIAPKKEGGEGPMQRACVVYWVDGSYKPRIEKELGKLFSEEWNMNPETDDIIIVLSEPFNDAFHVQAVKQYNDNRARISFFQIKNLISNPARHIMVPKHRKCNPNEIAQIMSKLRLKSKYELPHIKYHIDMQARVLGLVPGDVVEIMRPSETAGVTYIYRVCSP